MGPPGFSKIGWCGSIFPVRETMQRSGFCGAVSVIRSLSKVPRPTRSASAVLRRSTKRWRSAPEVQPEGIWRTEEIFPSAEMARLVEIRGRRMA